MELIPHEGVQKMKIFIDGMQRESEKIYRAKLDALAHGNEAVKRQVGEGKDLLSILQARLMHIIPIRSRDCAFLAMLFRQIYYGL